MLIGLGEPLLDPKIFDRIEYCERHNISTLLSTNGTFLDEAAAERLLRRPTGAHHAQLRWRDQGESFEYYRKGARFEKVRDNFVRFARMKHERGSKMQVVVQMVRMERNCGRGGRLHAFLGSGAGRRSGAHQGGRDQPDAGRRAGHEAEEWKHPCHYLWRGPMYVKHNGDVVSVLPELHAGRRSRWAISGANL